MSLQRAIPASTLPQVRSDLVDDASSKVEILAQGGCFRTDSNDSLPHRPTKKRTNKHVDESVAGMLRKYLVNHQIGLSLNFVLLLSLTHALFPSLRDVTSSFFSLSYAVEESAQYAQGPRDAYFVLGFVVYFTALRAVMLDYVLLPVAAACGISKPKVKVRFAEQAYLLLYYGFYWTWGLRLFLQDTPVDVATANDLLISLWKDFPRLLLGPSMKLYYLTQMAFWIQQIVVIHLEDRRKDHYQMLTHHFITVALMVGSYGYRQWRVGTAILVCMDVVDLIFPLAKILRYVGLQTACDCAFGLFVLTWIIARHVFYLSICWSTFAHVSTEAMFYGTYSTRTGERLSHDGGNAVFEHLFQPILNPEAPTFSFNPKIQNAFLALLLGLQAITIGWLIMIIRVVIRVIQGQGADDSRSDDEDDGEEADADMVVETSAQHASIPIVAASPSPSVEKPRFIEVESSSDDMAWHAARKGSSSSGNNIVTGSRKITKGISSGLYLGEHKEILNRIGCLSEEQLAREREMREGSSSSKR